MAATSELESLRLAAQRAGVRDRRVLDAVEAIDRSAFVPPHARELAGHDRPVELELGQTTSQPSLVARILEDLHVLPGARMLEVGTGTGYEATLAAALVAPGGLVVTVERHRALADRARRIIPAALQAAGIHDVEVDVRCGDGTHGASDAAPFSAIVIAAATDEVPPALFDQLADLGRLIAPVRTRRGTELLRFDRHGDRIVEAGTLGLVRYVPLLPGEA